MSRIPALDRGDLVKDNDIAIHYLPDATVEEAWNQGAWAYSFGADYARNPYVEESVRDAWAAGWNDSAANCEG